MFREVVTDGLGLQADTWAHLAASFDNDSNEVELYLDGNPVHSGTTGQALTPVSTDLRIGRSLDGEFWKGALDDEESYAGSDGTLAWSTDWLGWLSPTRRCR